MEDILQKNLLKNQDDSFFDFEKLTQSHAFERGFQRLVDEIPDTKSDFSIPPIEHYEKIAKSFEKEDINSLKQFLEDFASYLYKNGFDDLDEFSRVKMDEVFMNLCQYKKNVVIAQSSFHIITLLQTKGPVYPPFFLGEEFLSFCFSYLQSFSPLLYYSLVCITNICGQSENIRDIIIQKIPLRDIASYMKHYDICVHEAAIDLVCCYTKYQLCDQDCLMLITIVTEALDSGDTNLYHSCFWILVRLLRYYPDMTNMIMVPAILSHADSVLDDESSYNLIPGLIFISYVYEMNFEIPNLSFATLLDVFGGATEHMLLRQSYKTISKIIYRRPDLIPTFIKYGIIGQTAFALENAKFIDKVEIGLLICNVIQQDINSACDRILKTKSISLFLTLIEIDDDALTIECLKCLTNLFNETISFDRVDELIKRFEKNDGNEVISKLALQSENEEISCLANSFESTFLKNREE